MISGLLADFISIVLINLLQIYMWVVIIAAIISWVNPDPYNPIIRFLRAVTDPVMWRVRRWLPFVVIGGFDLSPIVVIVGIQFLIAVLGRVAMSLYGMSAGVM